jgi:hypothetical protein
MYNPFFSYRKSNTNTFIRLVCFVFHFWPKEYRKMLKPAWGWCKWGFHTPWVSFCIWWDAVTNPWPWLKAHLPVWCKRCNYVMFSRNARYARMTTGANVPLCEKCYHEIYTPFGGE